MSNGKKNPTMSVTYLGGAMSNGEVQLAVSPVRAFERAELDDEARKEVFPAFRACGADASVAMDPVEDQAAECAAQAIPRAAGVRLVPRNSTVLARWLEEEYESMGWSEQADGDEEARADC